MATPVQIGSWPEGQDTFHRETHGVFQPNDNGVCRLAAAVDVDLDDEGWARRRSGLIKRVNAVAGKTAFYGAGLLLIQDGGTIKRIDPNGWNPTVVVSGLSGARMSFYEHAGQVWWTDGSDVGVISSSGVGSNWGLSVPASPVLGTIGGTLSAGRYQVVCSAVDANGAESGSRVVSLITLSASGGISVSIPGVLDSNAVSVNVYASGADQTKLFWQKNVPVGSMPTTLTTVRISTRPLRTQFRQGPIAGDGIFSYMGWLLIWRGAELFRSSGLSLHLFSPLEAETLPDLVLGAVGLESGFWRVTSRGAWWTAGTDPTSWKTTKMDNIAYSAGGSKVSGTLFPNLNTLAQIALFVSEHGFMAGLPTGQMVRLTPDQLPLNVSDKIIGFSII